MASYYQQVLLPTEGLFKDRGSKFFAYAFPMSNEQDFQAQMELLKKEHPKARHHCFAYRLGVEGQQFRSSDDGEPSGTAGKPILGQLVKYQLTFTGVIVVRYFGGTKLGVSGLINAYRLSAAEALDQAKIESFLIGNRFRFKMSYSIASSFIDEAKKLNFQILDQTYESDVAFQCLVPKEDSENLQLTLLKRLSGMDFESIKEYSEFIQVTPIEL